MGSSRPVCCTPQIIRYFTAELNDYRLKGGRFLLRLKVAGLRLKPLESSRLRAGSRLARRCNLEVLAGILPLLIFDVPLDRLFVHRAYARTEIPARPKMLAPIPFLQLGKFILQ
jgi:hypothetical protein